MWDWLLSLTAQDGHGRTRGERACACRNSKKLKLEVKTVNFYRDISSGCRRARTLSVGTCGKVAKIFG